jgi:Skp family chaperone for outer membrane proteins
MSRQLFVIVAAAFASAFPCVSVSSAQEMGFGFVNTQEFMVKSAKAQAQRKKLLDLYQKKKTSLERQAEELRGLRKDMRKQDQVLEKEERIEQIKRMAMKGTELRLSEQEAKNTVRNEDRDMTVTLQQDLLKIIHKVRQDKRIHLVFNSSALLSAEEGFDLTDEVARAYDADASADSKLDPKPAAPGARPSAAGR